MQLALELHAQHVEVDPLQDREDRLGAHAGLEDQAEALLVVAVLVLAEHRQGVCLDRVAELVEPLDQRLVLLGHLVADRGGALAQRLQLLEHLVALLLRRGVRHQLDVGLLAGDRLLDAAHRLRRCLLQRLHRLLADHVATLRDHLVAERQLTAQLLVGALAEVFLHLARLGHHGVDLFAQLLVGGPELLVFALLDLGDLDLERLFALRDLPAGLAFAARRLFVNLVLQQLQGVSPGLVVDLGHDVLREVEDALQRPRRDVQQQAEAAGDALREPDVGSPARPG